MPSSRGNMGAPAKPARPRPLKGHILLDENTARRLRRARWRRIGVGMAVFVGLAMVAGLYLSPLTRVQKVEVAGNTTVNADEVKALAAFEDDSMFRLDLTEAQNRISYLPMVRSVEIRRKWPQTIVIEIIERTPWGFWQVGADRYVVDGEGVVLPEVVPAEGAPLVNDLSNPVRLVAGDHVDLDAVRLTQELVARIPETLSTSITSLEYSGERGLALMTDAGYRVVVGDSQNIDYKLAVWQAIEERLGHEAMVGHVLDLRFEDRPSFQ